MKIGYIRRIYSSSCVDRSKRDRCKEQELKACLTHKLLYVFPFRVVRKSHGEKRFRVDTVMNICVTYKAFGKNEDSLKSCFGKMKRVFIGGKIYFPFFLFFNSVQF